LKALKKKSLNAFLWDFGGTFGKKGLSFITSIFLARLLTPEEFGIVGMAMVFISLFQIFSDVGFTKGLIQSQQNTSVTYSSIFYINFGLGFILTVGVYFLAPFVGDFYENQQVSEILQYLSILFVLSSFNIVQQTIMEKELNMKVLNIRTISAQIVGAFVGITMAFQGYGVFSLVAQIITASIVTTIFLWTVTKWYPKLEFSKNEVKRLFSFSAYLFIDQIISRFFKEINTLFIGKVFSASTLGFFTRASSLNKLITRLSSTSLRKVFFPVLSQLQDDDESFKKVYYKLVAVSSFLSFGLTGFLFIMGDSLIIGLFGNQWEPSIIIFQILILKGYTYPISVLIGNSFLSKGKSKHLFYISSVRKIFTIPPLVIGYFYGLIPFVITVVIFSSVGCMFNMIAVQMFNGLSFWKHFKWVLEGIITVSLFILPYYLYLKESTIYIEIAYALFYSFIYLAVCYLRKHDGFVFLIENSKRLIFKK